jgi:hypothetical protein
VAEGFRQIAPANARRIAPVQSRQASTERGRHVTEVLSGVVTDIGYYKSFTILQAHARNRLLRDRGRRL